MQKNNNGWTAAFADLGLGLSDDGIALLKEGVPISQSLELEEGERGEKQKMSVSTK